MKKLVLIFAFALGSSFLSKADNYRIDEQQLARTFENSVEVSFDDMYSSEVNLAASLMKGAGEKTRGGYLVRAFFCGGFALHRYYMGTNRKSMWALYFCVPVVGGVTALVDFCWVLFNKDALSKYANNDKWMVWAGD
jgi:hypothetical protein